MTVKAVLILCAQALFIQTISAQCLLNAGNTVLGNSLLNAAYAPAALAPTVLSGCGAALAPTALAPAAAVAGLGNIAASSGGAFTVSSASPIAPSGVSVVSDNAIEGALAVAGQTPFLGAVALEGVVPTAGAGAVSYSCGNGVTDILVEDIAPAVALTPAAAAVGLANAGLGYGLAGGLGYNGLGLAGAGLNGLAGAGLGLTGVGPALGCGRGLVY